MNCKKTIRYIHFYIDGELEDNKQEKLVNHVEECPRCQKKLRLEKQFKMVLLKKTRTTKAPQKLKQKIKTVIF